VITLKGHLSAHFLQPVQASMPWIIEDFFQPASSRLSRCNGHAATHQPHPVQRKESILGRNSGGWLGISLRCKCVTNRHLHFGFPVAKNQWELKYLKAIDQINLQLWTEGGSSA
jgi:hypothetical protein